MKSKRWITGYRAWGLVAFFAFWFGVGFHTGTWESGDEDRYLTLALALSGGHGIIHLEHPEQVPESITPPGYPALLAMAQLVGFDRPETLKWTGALFLSGILFAVFALSRRLFPDDPVLIWSHWALGCGCVAMLSFSGQLMADLSTMAFCYLALVVYLRTSERTPSSAVLIGALTGIAYLCRAATIAFIGALLLDLLLRRRWRDLILFGSGLSVFALPWWFRNAVLLKVPDQYIRYAVDGAGSEQGGSLIQVLWNETLRDLPVFLRKIPQQHFYQLFDGDHLLARAGLGPLTGVFMGLFLVTVLIGWVIRMRRPTVLEYFLPAHLFLISAYPRPFYDTNYLFPILPLTAYYFLTVFQSIGRLRMLDAKPNSGRIIRLVATLVAFYALSTSAAAAVIRYRKEAPIRALGAWDARRYEVLGAEAYAEWVRYIEAGGWILSNMPPDTLVASRKAKHTFLFSGRRGWRYDAPGEIGATNVWAAMQRFTDVVFIEDAFATSLTTFNAYGNARRDVLHPMMEAHQDRIALLHETPPPVTRVWRVLSDAKNR